MPLYEYVCSDKDCAHAWEQEHRITELIIECPKCKQETAKRLIAGGSTFQLLGPRWAKDNYK